MTDKVKKTGSYGPYLFVTVDESVIDRIPDYLRHPAKGTHGADYILLANEKECAAMGFDIKDFEYDFIATTVRKK